MIRLPGYTATAWEITDSSEAVTGVQRNAT